MIVTFQGMDGNCMNVGDLVTWTGGTLAMRHVYGMSGIGSESLYGDRQRAAKESIAIVLEVIDLVQDYGLVHKKFKIITSCGLVGWIWSNWVKQL